MFEKLDTVDWGKLTHAYGPAFDVPGLLRLLASPDEEDFKKAIYELYGNIWHQGTVYEATSHAVPFLLELLEAPGVCRRDEVLILLAHIARGTSYHDVHQHLRMFKEKSRSQEWQDRVQVELGWVRNTVEAVKAGKPIYVHLLSHSDAEMREAAVYVLTSLDRPCPDIANLIWQRFEREPEEFVQATLLFGFGMLAEDRDANRYLLVQALMTQASSAIKLGAALGLVQLAPTKVPQQGILLLLEAILEPGQFNFFSDTLWGKVDGESLVRDSLARLEGEAAATAVNALMAMIPNEEHPRALASAEALLWVAFKKPIALDVGFDSLTPLQQQVVRAIAQNRNVWVQTIAGEPAESVKASMLVRSCGLPHKLIEFLAYATEEERTFLGKANRTRKGLSLAQRIKRLLGLK